jgi:PBP4 family serine-type D-alanyl-D-alanine carboxypeptidase
MKNPDMFIAGALRYQLRMAGITVGGSIARAITPDDAELLAEFKHPLSYLVGLVNKNSDNFLAEHVYKLVGASAGGQKQTGKFATETVKRILSNHGIPVDGICIYDGSGLCRKNLFSASVQTMLLNRALKLPFGQDFKNSLSVAGVDGTLKKRMLGTYAQSNLRAKTGTLRNTSALSGYAYTRDGEQLIFSIISNGPSVGEYKQLENRIGEAIANFSYASSLKGTQ